MKIDKNKLFDRQYAQITQSLFMSIRLSDYYEVLAEMLGDNSYSGLMRRFREYLRIDPEEHYYCGFCCPVDRSVKPNTDITVGEMIYNAHKILRSMDAHTSSLDPNPAKVAVDILDWTLIKPMTAIWERNALAKNNEFEERNDSYNDSGNAETASFSRDK